MSVRVGNVEVGAGVGRAVRFILDGRFPPNLQIIDRINHLGPIQQTRFGLWDFSGDLCSAFTILERG